MPDAEAVRILEKRGRLDWDYDEAALKRNGNGLPVARRKSLRRSRT